MARRAIAARGKGCNRCTAPRGRTGRPGSSALESPARRRMAPSALSANPNDCRPRPARTRPKCAPASGFCIGLMHFSLYLRAFSPILAGPLHGEQTAKGRTLWRGGAPQLTHESVRHFRIVDYTKTVQSSYAAKVQKVLGTYSALTVSHLWKKGAASAHDSPLRNAAPCGAAFQPATGRYRRSAANAPMNQAAASAARRGERAGRGRNSRALVPSPAPNRGRSGRTRPGPPAALRL